MFGSPLDVAPDLAVARGGGPVETDPMELVEGRTLRRRIAALVWIPATVGALALGAWTESAVVGLVGFALLIAALWVFAERGDRIVAWTRRRKDPAA
jgi:hypothetical protein